MRPSYEDPSGCLAPASTRTFLPGPAVSPRPPSPAPFRAGSSSRELCVSSRVLRPTACLPSPNFNGLATARPEAKSASLRVSSLYATSTARVHSPPGDPSPELWSVLGVSHALDGLLRATPCGFVSPRSHVQGFPSGVCPSRRSRTRFPAPLPSCRLNVPACRCDPAPANPPSTSGPCSPPEVRWHRQDG
jgi:hypothetical protein